jgi:hypothetical protein
LISAAVAKTAELLTSEDFTTTIDGARCRRYLR